MTNSDDRFHADLVAAVSRANADTARRALRFSHDLARALGDGVSQVEVGCYSFGEDAEIRFAVKPPGTAGSRVEVTVHRNGVRVSVDVASVDVPRWPGASRLPSLLIGEALNCPPPDDPR